MSCLHWPPLQVQPCGKGIMYSTRVCTWQDPTVCHLLCVKANAVHFKSANVVGQIANTRAQAMLKSFDECIKKSARQYCCAYQALTSLEPDESYIRYLKPLKDGNLTLTLVRHEHSVTSRDVHVSLLWESNRKISWLWSVPVFAEEASAQEDLDTTEFDKKANDSEYINLSWHFTFANIH